MDGFSANGEPPPEYKEVRWIADLFVAGMGVGWTFHYFAMAYTSAKYQTYCLNIMALCADFAWEIVYCFVYPLGDSWSIIGGFFVNVLVMYTAIRGTPNEWQHCPLVMRNVPLLFVAMTALFLGVMLAMAAQLGPALGYSFGAILCQMLISVGQVCQLLNRNNTRGASYTLWLSRFLGSVSAIAFGAVRYVYWPEAFSWLAGPCVLWCVVVFFASELTYGYCLYRIKREEVASEGLEYKQR